MAFRVGMQQIGHKRRLHIVITSCRATESFTAVQQFDPSRSVALGEFHYASLYKIVQFGDRWLEGSKGFAF